MIPLLCEIEIVFLVIVKKSFFFKQLHVYVLCNWHTQFKDGLKAYMHCAPLSSHTVDGTSC